MDAVIGKTPCPWAEQTDAPQPPAAQQPSADMRTEAGPTRILRGGMPSRPPVILGRDAVSGYASDMPKPEPGRVHQLPQSRD